MIEMTVNKALELFSINNIEDKNELKKLYRNLMKKNHPDAGGSQELSASLNKAYDILCTAFDNGYFIKKVDILKNNRPDIDMSDFISKEVPLVKLKFSELDKVLNKEGINIQLDGSLVVLTKAMLDRCKVLIVDELSIVCSNGDTHKYGVSLSYKYGSRELNCNAIIENLDSIGQNIQIKIHDKTIKASKLAHNSCLSYKFDNYTLNITVVR